MRLKGAERYDHIRKYRILEIEEQDALLQHEIEKIKVDIYDLTMELKNILESSDEIIG